MLHKCKTHSRKWCFRCAGAYVAFLVEHFTAEKVWPLNIITHMLGL